MEICRNYKNKREYRSTTFLPVRARDNCALRELQENIKKIIDRDEINYDWNIIDHNESKRTATKDVKIIEQES